MIQDLAHHLPEPNAKRGGLSANTQLNAGSRNRMLNGCWASVSYLVIDYSEASRQANKQNNKLMATEDPNQDYISMCIAIVSTLHIHSCVAPRQESNLQRHPRAMDICESSSKLQEGIACRQACG